MDPTTWTVTRHDGPNHLGLLCCCLNQVKTCLLDTVSCNLAVRRMCDELGVEVREETATRRNGCSNLLGFCINASCINTFLCIGRLHRRWSSSSVRGVIHTDYHPTQWPESPRTVF